MSGTLFDGFRRSATDLASESIDNLTRDVSPESIHELRIATKKLRSYWIAVRPVVGREVSRASVDRLRSSARLLANERDAYVRVKTLTRIREVAPKKEKKVVDRIEQSLHDRIIGDPGGPTPQVLARLQTLMQEEVLAWTQAVPPVGDESDRLILAEGIGRVYRKARRFGTHAWKLDTPAGYHRLRRWVKYLRYELEYLAAIGFDDMVATGENMKELGRILGQLHDIHEISDFISQHSTHIADPKDFPPVNRLLSKLERKLAADSQQLGRDALEPPPEKLVKRLVKGYDALPPMIGADVNDEVAAEADAGDEVAEADTSDEVAQADAGEGVAETDTSDEVAEAVVDERAADPVMNERTATNGQSPGEKRHPPASTS